MANTPSAGRPAPADRDWVEWHRAYDDANSSLARRRETVRRLLAAVIVPVPSRQLRLISMCAGDGGDVLSVLPAGSPAQALLVESDARLAARARAAAHRRRLPGVTVAVRDAGNTTAYAGAVPAQVVLTCGVFGNISPGDVLRTIGLLPSLLSVGGIVIWTRGRRHGDRTPEIRSSFAEHGFAEHQFVAPSDADFSVGVHQLVRSPPPYRAGQPLFTFRPPMQERGAMPF